MLSFLLILSGIITAFAIEENLNYRKELNDDIVLTNPKTGINELDEQELTMLYDSKNYENEFEPGEVIVYLNFRNLKLEPNKLFPELDIENIRDHYESLLNLFDPS